MSEDSLAALDALIATAMSEDGARNVAFQLAADDVLGAGSDGGANFGSEFC